MIWCYCLCLCVFFFDECDEEFDGVVFVLVGLLLEVEVVVEEELFFVLFFFKFFE